MFADLRVPAQQSPLAALFAAAGFRPGAHRALSPNIVVALQQADARKRRLLAKAPGWLQGSLAEFVCAEGSHGYLALENRMELYLGYTLKRV